MDMREVASNWPGGGNPTVTEDYDDSDAGNRVEWVDEHRVRVWKHGKMLYTGLMDSGIRNLVEALDLTVPHNPHVLPITVLEYWVVETPTSELHSAVVGYFWNEEDAKRTARGGTGWYGARNTYRKVTTKILGARRG